MCLLKRFREQLPSLSLRIWAPLLGFGVVCGLSTRSVFWVAPASIRQAPSPQVVGFEFDAEGW